MQMQRMSSVLILWININTTIDTMLQFDANADANANIDAQCEQTFKLYLQVTSPCPYIKHLQCHFTPRKNQCNEFT